MVDSLRRSGVGVESEDDLEYVHMKFRWFAEMHGVMGRRAAGNSSGTVGHVGSPSSTFVYSRHRTED